MVTDKGTAAAVEHGGALGGGGTASPRVDMGIGTPDCLMLTVCAEEGVYRRSPSEQADFRDRGKRGVTRRWHRQLHPSTTHLDGALGAESSEAYFMVASLGSRTVRPSALAVSSAVLGAASSWPGDRRWNERKQRF